MSTNDTEDDSEPDEDSIDTDEYELKEGYEGVRRAGLVLEGDDTVELDEETAEKHSDVLRRVANGDTDEGDSTDDGSGDDEEGE